MYIANSRIYSYKYYEYEINSVSLFVQFSQQNGWTDTFDKEILHKERDKATM